MDDDKGSSIEPEKRGKENTVSPAVILTNNFAAIYVKQFICYCQQVLRLLYRVRFCVVYPEKLIFKCELS